VAWRPHQGWTIGWLQLDGFSDRLQLKLAGNCQPDLASWKFRIHRIEPELSGDVTRSDEEFNHFMTQLDDASGSNEPHENS